MSRSSLYVGLDIGSATVKVVGVDSSANMVGEPVYLRHDDFAGQGEALKHALRRYLQSVSGKIGGIGVTGSGRELMGSVVGADLIHTEIFAHARGVMHLARQGVIEDESNHPITRVGAVIEIGGQDSKLIVFDDEGLPVYFNMNTICSAGTGEFLKQLADEAGVSIEEFGSVALQSDRSVTVDATCTVFSKRDFRHLTQKGVPLSDRLMGTCHALVRNYLRNVVRGAQLRPPILFQGGVASNAAVRQSFEGILGTKIHVTPHNAVVGALGMAVAVLEGMSTGSVSNFCSDFFDRQVLTRIRYCHGCPNACDLVQPYQKRDGQVIVLATLGGRCDGCQQSNHVQERPQPAQTPIIPLVRRSEGGHSGVVWHTPVHRKRSSEGQFFAGIDGGSRGTKFALICSTASRPEIIAAGSVDTAGDALGACRQALSNLRAALPDGASLQGIATTGSAGELFRDMITTRRKNTTDERPTEILAHYVWASHWMPAVATVIDIGGNDAKLIAVRRSGLDFVMNDKCAAGTGAFLEAIARRFSVPIADYAQIALQSGHPARIAGRCAVFGESDIVHKARLGFARSDLFLGLAFAVCRTYLADVGRGMLRLPIVAQGGAFLNKAVQHAFRETLELTDDEFIVSDDPDYVLCAGALGAALIACNRWEQGYESHFKGFEHVTNSEYLTTTTVCTSETCSRSCEEVVVLLENGVPIAGYKAIDCPYGFFSGMFTNARQRRHASELLARELSQQSVEGCRDWRLSSG